jgi:hypothetical protein
VQLNGKLLACIEEEEEEDYTDPTTSGLIRQKFSFSQYKQTFCSSNKSNHGMDINLPHEPNIV